MHKYKTSKFITKRLLEGALCSIPRAVQLSKNTKWEHFNIDYYQDKKLFKFNRFLYDEILYRVEYLQCKYNGKSLYEYSKEYIEETSDLFEEQFTMELFNIYSPTYYERKEYDKLIKVLKKKYFKKEWENLVSAFKERFI